MGLLTLLVYYLASELRVVNIVIVIRLTALSPLSVIRLLVFEHMHLVLNLISAFIEVFILDIYGLRLCELEVI